MTQSYSYKKTVNSQKPDGTVEVTVEEYVGPEAEARCKAAFSELETKAQRAAVFMSRANQFWKRIDEAFKELGQW